MYHDLPRTAKFWSFLFAVDQDLAETARKNACQCGGRLHCANYPRKPRGTPLQLPEPQCLRLSFCCDRDGCRKRVTPPSVRFLGPKVYLGDICGNTLATEHLGHALSTGEDREHEGLGTSYSRVPYLSPTKVPGQNAFGPKEWAALPCLRFRPRTWRRRARSKSLIRPKRSPGLVTY